MRPFVAPTYRNFTLFKQLLRKHCKVNSPIAPYMSAVGFHILIWVMVVVEEVAKVYIHLIKEVGVANGNPKKFGLACKQPLHLCLKSFVGTHFGVQRSTQGVDVSACIDGGREKSVVVEGGGVQPAYAKGVATTH